MAKLNTEDLSDKQRRVWRMRYHFGWRMKRIAGELGTVESAVSRLLRRAELRAGIPRRPRVSILRVQPRLARSCSLNGIFDC